jgi:PPOX class probable F420-dependent enzyme
MLDTSTEFGARAQRRLRNETLAWLTTVSRDGTPQPNPVWFLWQDTSVLLYSEPAQAKLKNIARNPKVSLNLQADSRGDSVVVVLGEARVAEEEPPAHELREYAAKYSWGFEMLGLSGEEFSRKYSTPIRIRVVRVRGF